MKDYIKIFLLFVIAVTLIVNTHYISQNKHVAVPPVRSIENLPKTSIVFSGDSFDFGDVRPNSEYKHVFKFKNTGAEPLIIEDAVSSCGCTIPSWPKRIVPPGEEGELDVVYHSGSQAGRQLKKVTMVANTQVLESTVYIFSNILKE